MFHPHSKYLLVLKSGPETLKSGPEELNTVTHDFLQLLPEKTFCGSSSRRIERENFVRKGKKDCVSVYVMLYKSTVFSGQCCYFPICFSFSMFRSNFHEMYKISRAGCMIFPCSGLECSDALAQPCSCDK